MKQPLTFILLFAATLYSQNTRTISIEKNNQGGYNIIRDGESIYVYTKRNCDSASLATLDDIFYEATKEGKVPNGVNIINLPQEKGTDLTTIIVAVLVAFISFFTFITGRYALRISAHGWRR